MYAVILHTIRQRQRRHSSTRHDLLDDVDATQPLLEPSDDDPAPQQGILQDVLQHAPSTPPHPSPTPGPSPTQPDQTSPIYYHLRSGRVRQGAPRKRGRGTRGRR